MPQAAAPTLVELWPIILLSFGAGLLSFLRDLWEETRQPGPEHTRQLIRWGRLALRFVVKVGGGLGAGFTAALIAYATGLAPAWQWIAACVFGVAGWEFFKVANTEGLRLVRKRLGGRDQ